MICGRVVAVTLAVGFCAAAVTLAVTCSGSVENSTLVRAHVFLCPGLPVSMSSLCMNFCSSSRGRLFGFWSFVSGALAGSIRGSGGFSLPTWFCRLGIGPRRWLTRLRFRQVSASPSILASWRSLPSYISSGGFALRKRGVILFFFTTLLSLCGVVSSLRFRAPPRLFGGSFPALVRFDVTLGAPLLGEPLRWGWKESWCGRFLSCS